MKGNKTFFTTGTDEHGLKVLQEANKFNSNVINYSNGKAIEFKSLCDNFNIKYDRFIRTTDEDHIKNVQDIWMKLYDKKLIYKGKYQSFYEKSNERYLKKSQVKKEIVNGEELWYSIDEHKQVEWIDEDNYLFKLSDFKDDIKKFYEKNDIITPKSQLKNILNILDDNLDDLSISRNVKNVPWGIPVPNDKDQTIYVWFDALINYITSSYKDDWPPLYQIIGKDILKFHTIYYPALLMALNIELPKHIIIHNFWTYQGSKMSKSIGNVVSPMLLHEKVFIINL